MLLSDLGILVGSECFGRIRVFRSDPSVLVGSRCFCQIRIRIWKKVGYGVYSLCFPLFFVFLSDLMFVYLSLFNMQFVCMYAVDINYLKLNLNSF